jgi:DNA-binding CsgD family transcriptional regulator
MNRKLPAQWERLSARERQVLELLGQGKTTHEISRLTTSRFKTVHTYYARLKSKLGAQNMTQLVRIAALSTTSEVADSLVAVLDRTEGIEVRFFDHRGKLIGKRKYRAEPAIEVK